MVALTAQVLPFLHPAMVGACAAALIPVVIHLINRRRHRRVPWAAMSFLLAAYRKSKRRIQLSHWLLLIVRMAVIVMLVLAIARPYMPAVAILPASTTRAHRVVVLDNSLSMRAKAADGTSRFQRAHEQALQLIRSFPSNDAVSIVTLAEPATAVVGHAALDRRVIRERLASVEASYRRGDMVGGISRVREILRESTAAPANQSVYILSDFRYADFAGRRDTRGNAKAGDAATPAVMALRQLADTLSDSSANLNLIKTKTQGRPNLTITDLTLESTLVTTRLPVRASVAITNFGPARTRQVAVQVRRDGEIHRRIPVPPLMPGESTRIAFSLSYSTAGTHVIRARLIAEPADALESDDVRYLSLNVRDRIPVLLVDGNPGLTLLAGEAGFPATALSPAMAVSDAVVAEYGRDSASMPTPIAPTVISPSELVDETLEDYHVVMLCDVPRLSASQWAQLERAVAHGTGLFFFVGEHVRIENYNRFGFADSKGLLPGRLDRTVDGTAGSATKESGEERAFLHLLADGLDHPVVSDFKGRPESGLFRARFDRYLSMIVDPGRGDVVLRFSDDEPALVASRFGDGRVLFFASTASLAWNNLAAKGDYVSLLVNAITYLSPHRGDSRNLHVGDTMEEPLRAEEAALSIRVTNERGVVKEGRIDSSGDALVFAYGPIVEPGVFRVPLGRRSLAFVSNVDVGESDLACVDEGTLRDLLDRPVNVVESAQALEDAASTTPTTELASFLLYALMAALFFEMWLAQRFSVSGGMVDRRVSPRARVRA